MRLTAFIHYGLRTLMRWAGAPDRVFSTAKPAREFGLSRNHIPKVMPRFAAGGSVTTKRGNGRGLTLAGSGFDIPSGTIGRLRQPDQSLVDCFDADHSNSTIDRWCKLKTTRRFGFSADLDWTSRADTAIKPRAVIKEI